MKAVLPDMGATSLSHPGRASRDEVVRNWIGSDACERSCKVVLLRNEKPLTAVPSSLISFAQYKILKDKFFLILIPNDCHINVIIITLIIMLI